MQRPVALLIVASRTGRPGAPRVPDAAVAIVAVEELERAPSRFAPRRVLVEAQIGSSARAEVVRRLRGLFPGALVGIETDGDPGGTETADFTVRTTAQACRLFAAEPEPPSVDCEGGEDTWFETDPQGRIRRWSQAFSRLLGREPSEGETVWSVLQSHGDEESATTDWAGVLCGGRTLEMAVSVGESTQMRAVGRLAVRAIRDDDGALTGLRGAVRHVAAGAHTAVQLAGIRAALDFLGEATVMARGREPRIVSISQRAEAFLDVDAADWTDRPLAELHGNALLALDAGGPTAGRMSAEVGWESRSGRRTTAARVCRVQVGMQAADDWWVLEYPEAETREERRELREIAGVLASGKSGEDLLQDLVSGLTRVLGVACAIVGAVDLPDRRTGRILATVGQPAGFPLDEVLLEGTASRRVLERRFMCVAKGLCREFPASPFVEAGRFEAFMGAALFGEDGEAIGVLSVFHTAPLQQVKAKRSVLMLFAVRISGELMRLRQQQALREHAARLAEVQRISRLGGAEGGPAAGAREEALHDIDATKQLLDACRREQVLQAAILDSLRDALIAVDPQGRIASANRRAVEMFGANAQALIGAELGAMLAPEGDGGEERGFPRLLHALKRGRSPGERPVRIRRSDGTEMPVAVELTEVRVGDALHHTVVLVGIGEPRAGRARDESATCETRNHERFETLGRLVAGVAHDFNNLVMGIAGFTDMALRDGELTAGSREDLLQVLRACGRARDVIHQMQLASQSAPIPDTVVDLGAIADEVVEFGRTLAPEDCVLRVEKPVAPVQILGHPSQLHEVLLNLIKNGWQSLPNGAGEVVVRVLFGAEAPVPAPRAAPGATWATLEVRDTGGGIAPDELGRIFEPFFTTKAPQEGSGLGLTVVRRIVENHGGLIGVESVVQRGSVFRLVFPLAQPAAGPVPVPEAGDGPDRIRLDGCVVWVVDDDHMVRDFVARGLARAGAVVDDFPGAWSALEAAKKNTVRPAVVVTDKLMPRMGGLELARRIREIIPGLPVVLITAMMETTTAEELQEAGVVGVLYKPFALSAILTEVAAQVRR